MATEAEPLESPRTIALSREDEAVEGPISTKTAMSGSSATVDDVLELDLTEGVIFDYQDESKVRTYATNSTVDSAHDATAVYTVLSSLPPLEGKTVLDLPCGMGHIGRRLLAKGAAKVIGADLSPACLRVAREHDEEAGVTGSTEYHQCDSSLGVAVPGQADVCVSIHLFCFMKTLEELRGSAQCMYESLAAGGQAYVQYCTCTRDQDEALEKYALFTDTLLRLDPWTGDGTIPRRNINRYNGFVYDTFMWDHAVVAGILRSVGFERTELVPYKADPAYSGRHSLKTFCEVTTGHIIVAYKGSKKVAPAMAASAARPSSAAGAGTAGSGDSSV